MLQLLLNLDGYIHFSGVKAHSGYVKFMLIFKDHYLR